MENQVVLDLLPEVLAGQAALGYVPKPAQKITRVAEDILEGLPKLLEPGTRIGEKIAAQAGKRGWTESLIRSTVDDPVRTVPTRDIRFLSRGGRMNDPAMAYYSRRGGYVVRNLRTGDIVQISDRTNPSWIAPWGN